MFTLMDTNQSIVVEQTTFNKWTITQPHFSKPQYTFGGKMIQSFAWDLLAGFTTFDVKTDYKIVSTSSVQIIAWSWIYILWLLLISPSKWTKNIGKKYIYLFRWIDLIFSYFCIYFSFFYKEKWIKEFHQFNILDIFNDYYFLKEK